MKKQYIVLSESHHDGWGASLITFAKANKLLKIEDKVYYIFHYNYCYTKKQPLQMKIMYPFGEYYDCLSINKYKEEIFEEEDDFVIITYDDTCEENCLILTNKS